MTRTIEQMAKEFTDFLVNDDAEVTRQREAMHLRWQAAQAPFVPAPQHTFAAPSVKIVKTCAIPGHSGRRVGIRPPKVSEVVIPEYRKT